MCLDYYLWTIPISNKNAFDPFFFLCGYSGPRFTILAGHLKHELHICELLLIANMLLVVGENRKCILQHKQDIENDWDRVQLMSSL